MMMLAATTDTADTIATLRAELARLQEKSADCWRLAIDAGATDAERNTAAARSMELDWRAGKIAARIWRYERHARR